jgi:hypothetical protein
MEKNWITQKPDYACAFLTRYKFRDKWEYALYRFEWCQGEPPEDRSIEDEETRYYYLAWLDNDGEEWDDIAECKFDEYLVIEVLPTQDEVHKEWIESLKSVYQRATPRPHHRNRRHYFTRFNLSFFSLLESH